MKFIFVAVIACVFLHTAAAERKRYDGYKVLEATPTTRQQLNALRDLAKNYRKEKVDFWEEPSRLNSKVHFMVSPEVLQIAQKTLSSVTLPFSIYDDNIQERLDKEWARLDERFRNPGQFAFDINDYNRYGDIMTWLEEKRTACRSGFTCATEDIGTSVEGRALRLFKLTGSGTGRRVVWSDSLIHAREWLAGATNLNILNYLLTSNDANVTDLLSNYDFYFLPVMNPDGYEFSFTDERFWRKSRNTNSGSDCMGTDLNRNYDQLWMQDGTSNDPCVDNFGGSGAGSEPETQAVQNFVQANGNKMLAFITVHTAAQMWLQPYGNTDANGFCERSPDHDDQLVVANAAADATENTHGTIWTRGNSCETIYATSGTTQDYAYAKGGVKYSYTPELRGPGFDPGKEAIPLSFEEIWNAYVALINTAARTG